MSDRTFVVGPLGGRVKFLSTGGSELVKVVRATVVVVAIVALLWLLAYAYLALQTSTTGGG